MTLNSTLASVAYVVTFSSVTRVFGALSTHKAMQLETAALISVFFFLSDSLLPSCAFLLGLIFRRRGHAGSLHEELGLL